MRTGSICQGERTKWKEGWHICLATQNSRGEVSSAGFSLSGSHVAGAAKELQVGYRQGHLGTGF